MAAIAFPPIEEILTGESLAPLLPHYKELFDHYLSGLQTKTSSAIDDLQLGVRSLQQAIENKKTYRLQTRIPAWVYSVFDWMGWGAVARAEKELHHVILEVFNRALTSPVLKEVIPAFIDPLKACYLQKYRDHELSKLETVQEILCNKGIEKPDFLGMLREKQHSHLVQSVFQKKLLWVLGDNYDKLAQMQYEIDEPGFKLNLFQLSLKFGHFTVFDWMIDKILPKCSEDVQKSLLTQKWKKTGGPDNAVHMLAETFGSKITFLPSDNGTIKIGRILKPRASLGKLISLFNQVSYPNGATDLTGIVVYCHGDRSSYPDEKDRDNFLAAMLNNP